MSNLPKISCLMVTGNRSRLVRRSVECFLNQSYTNKELVIVDDGEESLESVLADVPADQLKYVKLKKEEGNVLGKLRNRSLDEANGEFLAQWDDDDWYHPERLQIQADILQKGKDACCLISTLMHLDDPEFYHHPYIGFLKNGVPGTIMHRNDPEIRYPEMRRAEDTFYLDQWMKKRYIALPWEYQYLFIRCFHGKNTWEQKHFLSRIRNTPKDTLLYFWHKTIRGNLFGHPRFDINEKAQQAFEDYCNQSQRLGLHTNH